MSTMQDASCRSARLEQFVDEAESSGTVLVPGLVDRVERTLAYQIAIGGGENRLDSLCLAFPALGAYVGWRPRNPPRSTGTWA